MTAEPEILARLAGGLGLELGFDDDGAITAQVADGLDVTLDVSRDGSEALMVCDLGTLDRGDTARNAMLDLLDANPRLAALGTGTYARDAASGGVALVGRRPLVGLDPDRFEAWFGDFVDAALAGRTVVGLPPMESEAAEYAEERDDFRGILSAEALLGLS
ncbi:type III secretion system chaperone [Prosthecodimorpha staleyi]|uniref:Type III secretion system chaperone n=1 Tax=Prosthecodimorpha staleyi TaxID=2840188 RepID=A0A947D950_9HYPH|nr:type III secretion system chaperone [Prosthecodimorpha staleyi]MBT9290317.1 type III secretion system chaperone [Prosthecodimorpha staleyi]